MPTILTEYARGITPPRSVAPIKVTKPVPLPIMQLKEKQDELTRLEGGFATCSTPTMAKVISKQIDNLKIEISNLEDQR